MTAARILQPAGGLLIAIGAVWLLFQSAELLATALYGPAAHIPFEDGDAGFGQRPRSEHPSVSHPVGLASVTPHESRRVTGNGKD